MEAITKGGKHASNKIVELRTLNVNEMFNFNHDCGREGCITNHNLNEAILNIANANKPYRKCPNLSGKGVTITPIERGSGISGAIGLRFLDDIKTGLTVTKDTTCFNLKADALTSKSELRRRAARSFGECLNQWVAGVFGDKFNRYGMCDWGDRKRGPHQEAEEDRKRKMFNWGNHHPRGKRVTMMANGRMRRGLGTDDVHRNVGVRCDRNTTDYSTIPHDSFDVINTMNTSYYAVRVDGLRDELLGYTGKSFPTARTIGRPDPSYNVQWTRMHRMGQPPGEGVSSFESERGTRKRLDDNGDDFPKEFLSPFRCHDLIRRLVKERNKWSQIPQILNDILSMDKHGNGRRRPSRLCAEMVSVLHFCKEEATEYSSSSYNVLPIRTISGDTHFPDHTFFVVVRTVGDVEPAIRVSPSCYRHEGKHYLINSTNSYYNTWNGIEGDGKGGKTRLLPVTDHAYQYHSINKSIGDHGVADDVFRTKYIIKSSKDALCKKTMLSIEALSDKLRSPKPVIHLESHKVTNTEARAESCRVPNRGHLEKPGYSWNNDILYRKGVEFARLMYHRGQYFVLQNRTEGKLKHYNSSSAQFDLEQFFHALRIGGKLVTVIPVSRGLLMKASFIDWRKYYNEELQLRINTANFMFQKHMRARTNSHRYAYHRACLEAEKLYHLAKPKKFKEQIDGLRDKVRHVTMMMKEKSLDAVRASQ